jgi:hypothetical protein
MPDDNEERACQKFAKVPVSPGEIEGPDNHDDSCSYVEGNDHAFLVSSPFQSIGACRGACPTSPCSAAGAKGGGLDNVRGRACWTAQPPATAARMTDGTSRTFRGVAPCRPQFGVQREVRWCCSTIATATLNMRPYAGERVITWREHELGITVVLATDAMNASNVDQAKVVTPAISAAHFDDRPSARFGPFFTALRRDAATARCWVASLTFDDFSSRSVLAPTVRSSWAIDRRSASIRLITFV